MIDIESDIFNAVKSAINEQFPSAYVTGKETRSPSKFPCISIVEADNFPLINTQDSTHLENHVYLMYEINVYSNKANGSKAECKQLLAQVDETMMQCGFTRIMKQPVSLDDATKYRLTARYTAVAGKDKKIYRR